MEVNTCLYIFGLVYISCSTFDNDVEDNSTYYGQTITDCKQQTNVTTKDIKDFYFGGVKPDDITDNLKCCFKCFMEKQNYLKDGMLNVEYLMAILIAVPMPRAKAEYWGKATQFCKFVKGEDDCDTAYKITRCFDDYPGE